MSFVTAIIVAAGNSSRMNGIDKQLLIIDKIPVIARSTLAFQNNDLVDSIVIVTRPDLIDEIKSIISTYKLDKVINVVAGGDSRAQSVINGINAFSDTDCLLIHDGARPFISNDDITAVIKASERFGAAALAKTVTDTVKIVDNENMIKSTIDRDYVRLMQTPQVFKKSIYLDAVNKAEDLSCITDDCMLVENAGYNIKIVDSKGFNIKITTPDDINIANEYLRSQNKWSE